MGKKAALVLSCMLILVLGQVESKQKKKDKDCDHEDDDKTQVDAGRDGKVKVKYRHRSEHHRSDDGKTEDKNNGTDEDNNSGIVLHSGHFKSWFAHITRIRGRSKGNDYKQRRNYVKNDGGERDKNKGNDEDNGRVEGQVKRSRKRRIDRKRVNYRNVHRRHYWKVKNGKTNGDVTSNENKDSRRAEDRGGNRRAEGRGGNRRAERRGGNSRGRGRYRNRRRGYNTKGMKNQDKKQKVRGAGGEGKYNGRRYPIDYSLKKSGKRRNRDTADVCPEGAMCKNHPEAICCLLCYSLTDRMCTMYSLYFTIADGSLIHISKCGNGKLHEKFGYSYEPTHKELTALRNK